MPSLYFFDKWFEMAGRSPSVYSGGGKSELQRTGCRLTAGRCEATESAAEKIPPMINLLVETGKGEMAR